MSTIGIEKHKIADEDNGLSTFLSLLCKSHHEYFKNIIPVDLSLIFIFCSLSSFAQSDSCVERLASFAKNINTFNYLNPQEKVYLHFDNTSYFAGNTIWFKAYIVTATDIKPTIHSRVLYAVCKE